jgi:NAD(P)-dependent dehydrogenase (short-subunit alcohol dehydrogenase family)
MEKKTVVISGTSSGFGLLTSLAFAKQGYHVIATMRDTSKRQNLERQAQACHCLHNIEIVPLDVTDAEQVAQFALNYTDIDVLVNNAGFALAGFSEDTELHEYKTQFETNFFAAVALTNALLPNMRRRQSGRIINVSSISGVMGFPGLSPYVASKHALEGWSECLRLEVASHGIWVSLIEPGSFQTNIWTSGTKVAEKTQSPASPYYSDYLKIQRHAATNQSKMGQPSDVADKIVYIANAKRPKLRYPIGDGISLMILLKRILPWRTWQWLLAKAIK